MSIIPIGTRKQRLSTLVLQRLAGIVVLFVLSGLISLAIHAQASQLSPVQKLQKLMETKDMSELLTMFESCRLETGNPDPASYQYITMGVEFDTETFLAVYYKENSLSNNKWLAFFSKRPAATLADVFLGQVDASSLQEVRLPPLRIDAQTYIFGVEQTGMTGTGVYEVNLNWFLVDNEGLRQCGSQFLSGNVSGWGTEFDREIDSDFNVKNVGKEIQVVIDYHVKYFHVQAQEGQTPQIQYRARVVYDFSQNSGQFDLNPEYSQLSPGQIAGLFGDNQADFIVNNFLRLLPLTHSKNPEDIEWLRALTREGPDTLERRRLVDLLKKNTLATPTK